MFAPRTISVTSFLYIALFTDKSTIHNIDHIQHPLYEIPYAWNALCVFPHVLVLANTPVANIHKTIHH